MHLKTQHKEIEGVPEITLGEKMRNGIFLIVLSKYRFIIVENEVCVNWICTTSVYFFLVESLVTKFLMMPFYMTEKRGKQRKRSSVWRYLEHVRDPSRVR